MIVPLFEFKDNVFTFNKEELLTYKSFRALYNRDKGSPGDSEGRKKLQFLKECIYVYHVCHPNSVPNKRGFSIPETHAYAVRQAELPVDWKPDKLIEAALIDYGEQISHLGHDAIMEVRRTFAIISRIINKVRDSLDTKLTQANLADKDLDDIIAKSNKVIDISLSIPARIKELVMAEELLRSQNEDEIKVDKLPGGAIVPDSMKVDNDIDN